MVLPAAESQVQMEGEKTGPPSASGLSGSNSLERVLAFMSDLTLRFEDGSSQASNQYVLSLASPVLSDLLEACGKDDMELRVSAGGGEQRRGNWHAN